MYMNKYDCVYFLSFTSRHAFIETYHEDIVTRAPQTVEGNEPVGSDSGIPATVLFSFVTFSKDLYKNILI